MIYECLTCRKEFTTKKEAKEHVKEHPKDRWTEFRKARNGEWLWGNKYYVYREEATP